MGAREGVLSKLLKPIVLPREGVPYGRQITEEVQP